MQNYWNDLLGFFEGYVSNSQERQSLIKVFLPDMIAQGYSQNKAFNTFKEAGYGVNFYTFRDIYNETRYSQYLDFNIIFMDNDTVIPETFMTFSNNDFKARYKYVVSYGVQDNDTGKLNFTTFGVSSNDRLTKSEILERSEEGIIGKYQEREGHIFGIAVRKVFVNPYY